MKTRSGQEPSSRVWQEIVLALPAKGFIMKPTNKPQQVEAPPQEAPQQAEAPPQQPEDVVIISDDDDDVVEIPEQEAYNGMRFTFKFTGEDELELPPKLGKILRDIMWHEEDPERPKRLKKMMAKIKKEEGEGSKRKGKGKAH